MPFPLAELYSNTQSSNGGAKVVTGVSMTHWKRDERVQRCGICIKKFGLLRRKHHCRACGDICCRKCLGFCLVDIPYVGVDLAYTCARCIRDNTRKNSLLDDFSQLARAFDNPYDSRARSKSTSFPAAPTSGYPSPLSLSPCASFSSALTPCGSPHAWGSEYKVIVSQYHNQKLHSVCSLLGDYLECKGGAIVLIEDYHIWVLAHKGVRTSVLHSDTFISICHRAMKSKESISVSQKKKAAGERDVFRFCSAAPVAQRGQSYPLGCIVALDTNARDEAAGQKVQKTLENLSRLVMNLLVEEKTILRIYSSGDFKIFASNSMDLAPSDVTCFDRFGVAASPPVASSCVSEMSRLSRSKSVGEEKNFFSTSMDDISADYLAKLEEPPRKHACSDPKPKTELSIPHPDYVLKAA